MSLLIWKHAPPKCKPEVLSLEPTCLGNGNTVPCSYQNMGLQIVDVQMLRVGRQATVCPKTGELQHNCHILWLEKLWAKCCFLWRKRRCGFHQLINYEMYKGKFTVTSGRFTINQSNFWMPVETFAFVSNYNVTKFKSRYQLQANHFICCETDLTVRQDFILSSLILLYCSC